MTGKQKKQFEEAFLSAFSSYAELERLFSFELDVDLNTLSNSGKTMPEIILDIIKWTEKHNKLSEIIDAALIHIPGNVKLNEFKNSLNGNIQQNVTQSPANSIEQLISEDKIDKAIKELTDMAKKSGKDDLYKGLILLTARYNSNENDRMSGIIKNEDYKRERTKITMSLQYYLEQSRS